MAAAHFGGDGGPFKTGQQSFNLCSLCLCINDNAFMLFPKSDFECSVYAFIPAVLF